MGNKNLVFLPDDVYKELKKIMISVFGLPEDYFEMPDGWQPPDDPEFYEWKPPQKKKIKQAKIQSEAKEEEENGE